MGLHCISWIPSLWDQLVGLSTVDRKVVVNPLPDDVIIEILLRLPAEHVVQCRRVCRQWRVLTSTPYFIELHLKRASPSLLLKADCISDSGPLESDLFIFEDEEAKLSKIPKNSLPVMQHSPWPMCSWNGLVVLRTSDVLDKIFIVNPITRQQLAVTPPEHPGYVGGIFFNPLARDYELLCWHWTGNCCNYFIYALGAKTWRKITSYAYFPLTQYPAIVNGYLHWIVGHVCRYQPEDPPCPYSILVYSIDKEDFHVLPCPEQKCPVRRGGRYMLVMKEQLCLCYMKLPCMVLDIWVLQDYQNCCWIKTHSLDLHVIITGCPWVFGYEIDVALLGIRNEEELLFDLWDQLSFRYDLKRRVVRAITRRGREHSMVGGLGISFVSYTKSLVNLN